MSRFRRRQPEDESDLWSSFADLFGAMTLIFLVLFMLAAALVGDQSVKTVRAELVKVKKQNIVLLDEVERLKKELQRQRKEVAKYEKKADVSLSAVAWAVIMKADAADPSTSRYELMVIDPFGGRISNAMDESIMLSNRGASWISAGAEQIIARDTDTIDAGSVYSGTYRVLVAYQKGNDLSDAVTFTLAKKGERGGMEKAHAATLTFDRLQPLEKSRRVFRFDIDERGRITNIRSER